MRRSASAIGVVLLTAACMAGNGSGTGGPVDAFTLAVTGDILVHSEVAAAAGNGRDFGPLLAGVAPVVGAADLAVCHLETPLAPEGGTPAYGPAFAAPAAVAPAIAAAGFDACSTASNHSLDAGPAGVRTTLGLLDAARVAHTGTARDEGEARRPLLLDAGPARVALLAYTYGLNRDGGAGTGGAPPGPAWMVNPIGEARIRADARTARAEGAAFVVVVLHWGTEFAATPDPGQRDLAGRLLASPAVDLIVGHHPHVVQPVERIGSKYVAYSVGNLLSGQPDRCCPSPRDGAVLRVDVARDPSGRYRASALDTVATRIEAGSYRVVVAGQAGR